jgi:hypothetical protein
VQTVTKEKDLFLFVYNHLQALPVITVRNIYQMHRRAVCIEKADNWTKTKYTDRLSDLRTKGS